MPYNPAEFLVVALVGAAMLWTVRLVYGARRGPSEDLVKRVLLLAGWILLIAGSVAGTVGLTGPLLLLPGVGLLIVGLTYFKYMAAERRALLWALAVAAEKGIPLEQAARAFADERSVQIGMRSARLADLLEQGIALPTALSMSRNPLPADALLAARLGAESGRMGEALRMSLDYGDHFEAVLRDVAAKYCYLLGIVATALVIVSFTMLRIVPVFTKMFEEFELELPRLTILMVAVSEFFVVYWWFIVPLALFPLLALLAAGVTFYLGSSRYELPLLQRIWLRCDSSLVMRALAVSVRQQQDLAAAVYRLSRQYPRNSIGRRLAKASQQIDNGQSWTEALQRVGLIRIADRAVLESAQRVGNLAWALDEMADSTLRRFAYRLRATIQVVFPLVIVGFGVLVFWFVTGLFLPLIAMIQGLS
jgi:general secretion pathway protein F